MPSEFAPPGGKPRVTKKQIKQMQENYKKAGALLQDTSEQEAEEKAILDELFEEELENAFVVRKKIGIYIGRFQPLHKGHENVLKQMIEDNDIVLVFIGTGGDQSENPFPFQVVQQFFSEYIDDDFIVLEIQDTENDKNWVENIFAEYKKYGEEDADIFVYGGNMQADSAINSLKEYLPESYRENTIYREIPRDVFLHEVDGQQIRLSGTKCREAIQEKNKQFLQQVLSENVYGIII